jgi:hypothetical protein
MTPVRRDRDDTPLLSAALVRHRRSNGIPVDLGALRLWKETSRKIKSRQAGQDWSSSFASNGEGNKTPVVSVPAGDRRARCVCVCEDSYSRRW